MRDFTEAYSELGLLHACSSNSKAWYKLTDASLPTRALQGYTFYLIIFYMLVAVLYASVVICIWVGWCFMNDNFPFLWPIKVARVVVSLFVSMFYIAALNIFLMACACKKVDSRWEHLVFHVGEYGS